MSELDGDPYGARRTGSADAFYADVEEVRRAHGIIFNDAGSCTYLGECDLDVM